MIDESPLTVAQIPAEIIEKKVELGAEAQQPRAMSRRLAGRHASHDQESILAELALSKK